MIDTERAAIDLKTSLSKTRHYIKRLKEAAESRPFSRDEKKLAEIFHYDLAMITREAQALLKRK